MASVSGVGMVAFTISMGGWGLGFWEAHAWKDEGYSNIASHFYELRNV